MTDTATNTNRIAELEEELATLRAEASSEVEDVIEEVTDNVEEAAVEAAEEIAEAIEEETGETVAPDERAELAGLVAAAVVEKLTPYLNVVPPPTADDVADAVVEEVTDAGPDTPPARTHWLDRRII